MTPRIPPRDPRIDPRPGDEFSSGEGKLKAKVVSITLEESGIALVRYKVGRHGEEYWATITSRPLEDWQYFIKDAAEVTCAKD